VEKLLLFFQVLSTQERISKVGYKAPELMATCPWTGRTCWTGVIYNLGVDVYTPGLEG
jgi:hypothetical protein